MSNTRSIIGRLVHGYARYLVKRDYGVTPEDITRMSPQRQQQLIQEHHRRMYFKGIIVFIAGVGLAIVVMLIVLISYS